MEYRLKTKGTFKKVKDYKHVTNVSAYSLKELEKRGITDLYQVVKPELTSNQRYGEEVIDEKKKTITYSVVDIPEPTIQEIGEIKKEEFAQFSLECQQAFRERKDYYEFRGIELPEAYEMLRAKGIEEEQNIVALIDSLVASNQKEKLQAITALHEKTQAFLSAIKAM